MGKFGPLSRIATAGVLALSSQACTSENADAQSAEAAQKPTKADCFELETDAKLACLKEVQEAEIAEKQAQRDQNAETIAAQEKEAEELDNTIDDLTKQAEERAKKPDDQ